MQQYVDVVQRVLQTGTRKENRTGVDTLSTFNVNYTVDLRKGFPLLTTKKISWKNIVVENLWFLSGDPHVALLKKHGCKFWDPWVNDKGFVPSAYGNFWRRFPVPGSEGCIAFNDQIAWVIDELRRNPMSRRLVVSAWAPGNAQTSTLPPCHLMFVFNVQNHDSGPTLNLHLTQRSCDVALGLPYNLAGYSFILSIVAHLTSLRVGYFAHSIVDAHIYTCKSDGSMVEYDHVPGLRQQIAREPMKLPSLKIDSGLKNLSDINGLLDADTKTLLTVFRLDNYDPYPTIDFKVAV